MVTIFGFRGLNLEKGGRLTRRSRREIFADILNLIDQTSPKKTEIMYKCNLSWETVDYALKELIERKMIVLENNRQYQITDKGQEVLRHIQTIQRSF